MDMTSSILTGLFLSQPRSLEYSFNPYCKPIPYQMFLTPTDVATDRYQSTMGKHWLVTRNFSNSIRIGDTVE